MKKRIRRTIFLFLIALVLLGCQQQNPSLDSKEEIKEVHIYKSSEFKKENSDLIVSANKTENTEIFEMFKSIISSATKQEGVADTVEPNYYLDIIYQDNQTKELYLWLLNVDDEKGSLMEVEDTHTIYHFSEELNAEFMYLIHSVKK